MLHIVDDQSTDNGNYLGYKNNDNNTDDNTDNTNNQFI